MTNKNKATKRMFAIGKAINQTVSLFGVDRKVRHTEVTWVEGNKVKQVTDTKFEEAESNNG